MTNQPSRVIRVAGAYNVRDFGGHRTSDGAELAWNRLWRADSLHRLEEAEQDRLAEAGLRTVIDLRTAEEVAAAPSPFRSRNGVRYHSISLFSGLAPIQSMFGPGLPPFDMALRYRSALDARASAFAEVLHLIKDADEGLVVFHCTAGKDRAGLVSAFVLLALDVDPEAIVADYAMTADVARPLLENLLQAAASRGHDLDPYRAVLASDAATMTAALRHLADQHGGVVSYLDRAGFGADDRQRLRERLVAAPEH